MAPVSPRENGLGRDQKDSCSGRCLEEGMGGSRDARERAMDEHRYRMTAEALRAARSPTVVTSGAESVSRGRGFRMGKRFLLARDRATLFDRQYRARCATHHSLSDTPEQQMPPARPAVRAHDDHIHVVAIQGVENFVFDRSNGHMDFGLRVPYMRGVRQPGQTFLKTREHPCGDRLHLAQTAGVRIDDVEEMDRTPARGRQGDRVLERGQ